MRLSRIKLAGFKSFVDPTTIELKSNMVCVVGPNGCGKSNVIDAVRWVLGESSAKNLRGESMADVIFNGSSTRKPVGQASVELVFDNSEGHFGGEYAKFSEISVRRLASRDGSSTYYLNAMRCRRKDITDLFLGTGLGPRSYAIIEQGMISRLIEAKPQELRLYIEEAAGISKYKERRKETESRMQQTLENLARIRDVRDELDRKVQHLERQAQTAAKYQTLKAEEKIIKTVYHFQRWEQFSTHIVSLETAIQTLSTQLEDASHAISGLESVIAAKREILTEKTMLRDEVQKQYYALGNEITRIEQRLIAMQERYESLLQESKMLVLQNEEIERQKTRDEERLNLLQMECASLKPAQQSAEAQLQAEQKKARQFDETMSEWRLKWEQFARQSMKPQQQAEVERTRIEQLDQQLHRGQLQCERLQDEQKTLDTTAFDARMQELKTILDEFKEKEQLIQADTLKITGDIQTIRKTLQDLERELDGARRGRQQKQGEFASVQALQQAALGKRNSTVSALLSEKGITGPRFAETLKVKNPIWQQAVEIFAGEALASVCVEQMDDLEHLIDEIQDQNVQFVQRSRQNERSTSGDTHPSLESVLETPFSAPFAASVYLSETTADAFSNRHTLQAHEFFLTPNGVMVGKNWVAKKSASAEQKGVLAREEELVRIQEQLNVQDETIQNIEQQIQTYVAKMNAEEAARDEAQKRWGELKQQQSQQQSEFSSIKSKSEQFKHRSTQIQRQIEEERKHLVEREHQVRQARSNLQSAVESMAVDAETRQSLSSQMQLIEQQQKEQHASVQTLQTSVHQSALKLEGMTKEQAAVQQSLERTLELLRNQNERLNEVNAHIANFKAPEEELRLELQSYLESRSEVEQAYQKAQSEQAGLDLEIQTLEKERAPALAQMNDTRTQLEKNKMSWQEFCVRREGSEAELKELEFDFNGTEKPTSERSNDELENDLKAIQASIARLGSINLAAVEEHQAELERKSYIDVQVEDLEKALNTLTSAIQTIDEETKGRFKETYERVNQHFGMLFPKLFGGGSAYLELESDDLLETGVAIMARPPGKRNSSIHLLSGGEKALTAVAMVFSIFQLNPAPFCMLDEVDAPLDDANVGRYCQMVKEFSNQIQFIYISHSKLAMEMSEHLMGVTMKEPGVSRLVTVDLQQAEELAFA